MPQISSSPISRSSSSAAISASMKSPGPPVRRQRAAVGHEVLGVVAQPLQARGQPVLGALERDGEQVDDLERRLREDRDVRGRHPDERAQRLDRVLMAEVERQIAAAVTGPAVDDALGDRLEPRAHGGDVRRPEALAHDAPHAVVAVALHVQQQPLLEELEDDGRRALAVEVLPRQRRHPAVVEQGGEQVVGEHLDAALAAREDALRAQVAQDRDGILEVAGVADVEERQLGPFERGRHN